MNRREKRDKKKEINILREVINVINQYFPELINNFEALTDLRNQSYVTYKMKVIFMVRLMGLMCEIKSMHELTSEFNTEEAIENMANICGLKNEYQEYSTYVLEAKLVVGNMVFSIGSEFVENGNQNMSNEKEKQDCERKAFVRLAEKLKKEYPKLKMLLSADALYACKPVIDICKENGWKYIIRFKEGAIPTLYQEYEVVVKEHNESNKANYEFVTGLDYQEEKVNIIRYEDQKKKTEFTYITDLPISDKNIESSINIGRKRWKIENEGFNIQKNGTFDIGHLYSKNQVAIKVHYLMIQIAHILRQLVEKGVKGIKGLKLKLKEISQTLKEQLISTITNLTVHSKIQLRFD